MADFEITKSRDLVRINSGDSYDGVAIFDGEVCSRHDEVRLGLLVKITRHYQAGVGVELWQALKRRRSTLGKPAGGTRESENGRVSGRNCGRSLLWMRLRR